MPGFHTHKTAERGYDGRHQRERERWRPKVETGLCDCARCGKWIRPGTPWDLGHDDHDRNIYRGPEHMSCNRQAGGRNGARVANAKRGRVKTIGKQTSREW